MSQSSKTTLAESLARFDALIAKRLYVEALAETAWLRNDLATKGGSMAAMSDAVKRGEYPSDQRIADALRDAALFGDAVSPLVLLVLADIWEGKVDRRGRRRRPALNRNNAIIFLERIGDAERQFAAKGDTRPKKSALAKVAEEDGVDVETILKDIARATKLLGQ